jgi:molybdopterin synthase sulfur carrier subunit
MVTVFIPSALRRLTNGAARVEARGRTVRALIDDLDSRFPGLRQRLSEDGRLKPGLAVVVGTSIQAAGLLADVPEDAEVHFVPAVGGG